MSFNVFLTYSMDPAEESLVWRLQTLATAEGINLYVPPASKGSATLRSDVRAAIDRCDCVLAIVTARAGTMVQQELNYALSRGKVIVPIVQQGVGNQSFWAKFPHVFWFSPLEPAGRVESEVVGFLGRQKLDKESAQALGAMVAIGVGMLLLRALATE